MNPWAILGIILTLSAIGAGIFTAGKRVERAAWAERDREALVAAYKARDKALVRVAELEAKSVRYVQEAEAKARKANEENKLKIDTAVAAAGERQLRNVGAICAASNRSAAAKAGSAARKAAEAEGAELRRAYAEPFIRLAGEANEVVIERNEAVEIAIKDREICK